MSIMKPTMHKMMTHGALDQMATLREVLQSPYSRYGDTIAYVRIVRRPNADMTNKTTKN